MKQIQARQILAGLIALAMATPAAASPATSTASGTVSKSSTEVVGILAAGQGAALRDAAAQAGTTIYSGDTLKTFRGEAVVAIGDSQLRLAPESRALLLRAQGRVQVELQRGRTSLRNSSRSPVEARLADATITIADAGIVGIAILSESKAIVAAERGGVTLRAARDNKSVTLRAGESVEVTLASQGSSQNPQDQRDRRGGAALLSAKKVAIFGAVLIGGISLIAWALRPDNDLARGPKQDLISPFQLR